MSRKSFAPGALLAPTPPVLVTVGEGSRANIITIGWTGILATHPPRTYVSVRPSRHSYEILKKTREFVINLPIEKYAREVDFCGIYTGAKVDKFEKCGFTKAKSEVVSAPTIKECPVAIECRVCEIIPMGTHDVFIADIVSVSCDEGLLDTDGRICFERAGLLAYVHGEYFSLGKSLGKFGFSTAKKAPTTKPTAKSTPNPTEKSAKKAAPDRVDKKTGEKAKSADEKGAKKRPFYENLPKKFIKKSHPVSKKRQGGSKK